MIPLVKWFSGSPKTTGLPEWKKRADYALFCKTGQFAGYNRRMMFKTFFLFVATALAEIIGCWLPYLWLRQGKSAWLLLPAAAALSLFAWLLTLHPAASGRVYAAYGGVYIATALLWLRLADGVRPTWNDWLGAALCLCGAAIIALGKH